MHPLKEKILRDYSQEALNYIARQEFLASLRKRKNKHRF